MRRLVYVCVALSLSLGAAVFYLHPMIASALGLAARQACSLHFSAGLPPSLARETYINRHIRPVGPYVSITLDETGKFARASLLRLLSATARYRDGYGCVLDLGRDITPLTPYPPLATADVPVDLQAKSAGFDTAALDRAIEASFEEPSASSPRQTMAVLVLSEGRLVAEKYADGVQQSTPLPGFSMAKSMTATMIGLLVEHKNLDVMSVVPNAGKLTQAGVTYDQLLRMTSGIGVKENGSGRDANSIMLTQTHDAAGYAGSRDLLTLPGEAYAYTGGGPVVLARQFIDIAGDGDPSKAYRFLSDKLLTPLGLSTVVLETDGAGTFLGSSFMLASALDWARLGQLYLQNGSWNGTRILPDNWAHYVGTKTPQSHDKDYGAGFWVAVSGGRDSRHAHLPRPPEDAFFMHGMMNQAVYILPSQSLVVVRLGATGSYLQSGEWELLAEVIDALEHEI